MYQQRKIPFLLFVLVGLIAALLTVGAPVFADDPTPGFVTNTPLNAVMVTTVPLDMSFGPFEDGGELDSGDESPTNTQPVIVVQQPIPAEPGIPKDIAFISLLVVGTVFVVIIIVWGVLQGKTGAQLYNSWPAPVQYGTRFGLEYMLHEARKTPAPEDEQTVEQLANRLGFTVTYLPDGSITLNRPTSPPIVPAQ